MSCELCKRDVETLTRHHLKPKARGGAKGRCAMVCKSCAEMIHQLISNKELDKHYDTVEKLLSNDEIKKYVNWVSKQKRERVTIATKKRKLN